MRISRLEGGIDIKSYNGLYDKMFSDENLRLAIVNAGKHKYKKNKRHEHLKFMCKLADEFIPTAKRWLKNYEPAYHEPIEINDGISAKKRMIIVPTVQEVVIHHAITNVLKEIIRPSMYEHSYASIPGKGIHQAMKTVKKWIYNDSKNTRYCLKLDIRKFFDSIDQEVLLNKLRKIIRDKQYFEYIEKVVRTVPRGIPLGFTTSQWFANFLLTELDHKIKEEMKVKHYIRFMDDMVLFGSNKRKLHKVKEQIEKYLNEELYLQLKGNWQVFPMDGIKKKSVKKGRFLDFLGFKFYRDHIGLRRKIALRIQRKAKRIYKKGRANIHDARQMVVYAGFVKYANIHNWFKHHVLLYVSIKRLRKKISNYDKMIKGGLLCGTT